MCGMDRQIFTPLLLPLVVVLLHITDCLTAEPQSATAAPLPEPPTNLSVLSCGDIRVELQWDFQNDQSNNDSLLQEFIVEYNTNHDPGVWHEAMRVPADKREATYVMTPWARYTFRARSRSLLGVSEPSEATWMTPCQSAEARPYSNPRHVHTVGDQTGWLIIEWQPMTWMEHNGHGFFYTVTWRPSTQEGNTQSVRLHDWRQRRWEVEVGGVYQPYRIKVEAGNDYGYAVAGAHEIIGHSGEAAPRVVPENLEVDPNDTISSTSATFCWDPVDPSPEGMNGKFRGYKIRHWKRNQRESTLQEEMILISEDFGRRQSGAGEKIHGRAIRLPPFSEVEADVVAANTYFISQGSNVVSLTTPEGVPSIVEFLNLLFRDSSHILLEWGPPLEPNGVLTGYQLGYQKVEGLSIGEVVIAKDFIPVHQVRSLLHGLEPNTLYRVFVAARTAVGPGQLFSIDVRTTADQSAVPGASGSLVTLPPPW